jgi:YggT family protein
MLEFLGFISFLLRLYVYVLIAAAVLSWLVAFNVVNMHNEIVRSIGNVLFQLTEPVLRPIRNILPNMGGIDLSPVVVILIIIFIQNVILPNIARAFIG